MVLKAPGFINATVGGNMGGNKITLTAHHSYPTYQPSRRPALLVTALRMAGSARLHNGRPSLPGLAVARGGRGAVT